MKVVLFLVCIGVAIVALSHALAQGFTWTPDAPLASIRETLMIGIAAFAMAVALYAAWFRK